MKRRVGPVLEADARGADIEAAAAASQAPVSGRRRNEDPDYRFRTMADNAPVLLWMAGPDALRDFFNRGWLSYTGRELAEEVGNGWAEGVHPEDLARTMQVFLDAFVARHPFAVEYRLRRHDGAYRWIFDQGTPRFEPDGTFAGFVGSCVDVTAQYEAREALCQQNHMLEERVREDTALAAEREMLLREVHHRVKNDLQVLSSLLGMHGRQFEEEAAAARAFEECQGRVQAMARVHEQMSRSRDLPEITLSEHLRLLALEVNQTGAPPPGVELVLDIGEHVVLGGDQAIPCAMIVHELCRNAFKHAFPSGKTGSVRVSCRTEKGGGVVVQVEDDGVGMPRGAAPLTRGLGWTLIDAFAGQLGAIVEVQVSAGTRVTFRFAATGAGRAHSRRSR